MTKSAMKKIQKNLDWQEAAADLADKFLDEALAKGEPFTEGLCNWAMQKALQEFNKKKSLTGPT